jgi:hypothetical protein
MEDTVIASLIDLARQESPGALELARLVSPAPRIEPELLRAVRIAAAPNINAGAEGDLWFGPLVDSRGALGVTLHEGVAARLRDDLAKRWAGGGRERRQLERSRRAMERVHETVSPALALEERVAWLEIEAAPESAIEEELWSAVHALADPSRAGVARWALEAWSRLPDTARHSRAGWVLCEAASARLRRGAPRHAGHSGAASDPAVDLAALVGTIPVVGLGVVWTEDSLRLGAVDGENAVEILVPAIDPHWLELTWLQDRREGGRIEVRLRPDSTCNIARPEATEVRIVTATGDVYEMSCPSRPPRLSRTLMIRGAVASVAVRGGTVVSAGEEGTVRLWDVATGAALMTLTGHVGGVRALAVGELAGRPIIVSGGNDRTVRVWDLQSGQHVMTLTGDDMGGVWALTVGELHGRPIVVCGGNDPTLWVWDLATGAPQERLRGPRGEVRAVALGDLDGDLMVVAGHSDGTLLVWDLASGAPLGEPLIAHRGGVWAVALSVLVGRPIVVSGGADGTIRVWDLATGAPLGAPLAAHHGGVRTVALGEVDGRAIVISGGYDASVRIWDLATGAPHGELLGEREGPVQALAVAEEVIVAGGADGAVRVWDMPAGPLAVAKPMSRNTSPERRADVSRRHHDHAARLSGLRRYKEALHEIDEAVTVYRELAETQPDAFLPSVAGSLKSRSSILSALGRRDDAFAAIDEAVEIYRGLTGTRRDAFLSDFAASLTHHANMLSELESHREAFMAIDEMDELSRHQSPHEIRLEGWEHIDLRALARLSSPLSTEDLRRFYDGATPSWDHALESTYVPRRHVVADLVSALESRSARVPVRLRCSWDQRERENQPRYSKPPRQWLKTLVGT